MNYAILCFVAALVIMGRLPIILYDPLLLIGVPLAFCGLIHRNARIVCAGYLGVVLAGMNAANIQASKLPEDLEGDNLVVEGTVSTLPQPRDKLTRFHVDVTRFPDCVRCRGVKRISLSWYDDVEVRPGERWRFTVKLDRPRGQVNPGLFDYEGWLFAGRINATGYVRKGELLDHSFWRVPHHQFRHWLRAHMESVLDDSGIRGLVVALTLGESSEISIGEWRILSSTGTNHLFIISGLHVGLVTALFYRLFLLLCRQRSRAGVMSLGAALIYGGIAGMGLPVQRALIMTTVAMAGIIFNRKIRPATLFCFALLGVTLINPLAVSGTGFWLSFGAVFSLLFVFAGRKSLTHTLTGWMRAAIHTQWVVYVGMLPLLMFLVFQVSLASFLVNLVAIPWIGFLVVPPLLLASALSLISQELSAVLFGFAESTLAIIWQILSRVADQDLVIYAGPVGLGAVVSGFLGATLLLCPKGFLPRWPGLIMLIPVALPPLDLPDREELDVTVFDVGQGLSVFLRTREGAVLYDAGPRFGDRFDAGEQIVTPFIRRSKVRHLDGFVVSHMDNDHAGGAQSVMDNFTIGHLWSSEPEAIDGARSCMDGGQWSIDGVSFQLLALSAGGGSKNDRSCVLLVQGPGYAILLPGDIEAMTEHELAKVPLPDIDMMLAPHHGSRSSSSPAFLNHVMPGIVVVSAGHNNRFRHPDPAVVRRYQARHARVLTTGRQGAISMRFGEKTGIRLGAARRDHRRFWHDRDRIRN